MSAYKNPLILIPMIAMFVIIFGIVLRSLKEMDIFPAGSQLIITLCVTVLAMYGMDQALVRVIVGQYMDMGVIMLFGLAGLLLTTWIGLTVKTRQRLRRSHKEDEKRK